MGDFKDELQTALGYILGTPLKGPYSNTAEVVAAFNTEWKKKLEPEKQDSEDEDLE